jgi:ATP-dependent DNA helicase Q1
MANIEQLLSFSFPTVQAVMLTSATSKEDATSIFRRLTASSLSHAAAHESDIKLLYVTPERLARSKSFMSLLEKLSIAGKLGKSLACYQEDLS